MAQSGAAVATTLALITFSLEQQPRFASRDLAFYDAIDNSEVTATWPAEFRAELYARGIEHPEFNTSFTGLRTAIVAGLKASQQRFP